MTDLSRSRGGLLAWLAPVLLAACSTAPLPERAPVAAPPRTSISLSDEALKAAGILVDAVTVRSASDEIVASAVLAFDDTRTARIGSLQEGLILDTRVQVGDRVRARQLIATMHGHAMHDAWAGFRKAIADRRRVEKAVAYAVDVHERAKRLHADKAIARQELDRAEVERVSAQEQLEMARAEVLRSIEELEHVGVIVNEQGETADNESEGNVEGQIPVRSPLAGTVIERLVTPGTTVTPGTPLFVVSDLTRLWAIAEVDESHLGRLQIGRTVDLRVAAYPTERFIGRVAFIADVVNPTTRRVTVRAEVPNPDRRLKPEMFASVLIGASAPRTVLVVPAGAVQSVEGQTVVFVSEAGGRFTARPVRLGAAVADAVEVLEGLREGERVVAAGSFVLKSELMKPADEGH